MVGLGIGAFTLTQGLLNQLRKRLIERAAGAELEQHLGYPPGAEAPETQSNRRNGTTSKTLRTLDGPVTVELPRDRDASFEPRTTAQQRGPDPCCITAGESFRMKEAKTRGGGRPDRR